MFSFLTQLIAQHGVIEATEPVSHAAEASSEAFNINSLIAHHLTDAVLWPLEIGGVDLSITKRVVMLWIAAALMLLTFIPAARFIVARKFSRPGRFSGIVEVFVEFLRNGVVGENMGHHAKPYVPYIITLFFFVLFSNLLGLIPPLGELVHFAGVQMGMAHEVAHGSHDVPLAVKLWPGITATGDISVTGALAIISLLVILVSGFAFQGIAYIKNIVPENIPLALWPLMWVVEFVGIFTKAFALAVRLLANMTAGHMLLLVLMGFIFQFQNYGVAAGSVVGSMAIYALELLVAFLQAYIFVLLTALFVAGAQHRH